MILIVVGCLWLGLATLFVLALMGAASRRVPSPNPAPARPAAVTMDTQDSALPPRLAADAKEIAPMLDA